MARSQLAAHGLEEITVIGRSIRALVPAAVLLSGAAAVPAMVGTASSAAAAGIHVLTQQTVPVPTLPGGAPAATLVGPLDPATPMIIDVGIDNNLAAKQAAVAAVYNPSSPSYHHYYTSATWDAQFGVPQATFTAVVDPLTSLGMKVLYSDETNDLVELGATAAEVNTAFNVTEQEWQFTSGGRTYFANNQPPTVAADVDAVQGLTDIGLKMKAKPYDAQDDCAGASPNVTCVGALEGWDLRNIYDVGTTDLGAGQALAVNGDGDPQGPTADLHKYETDQVPAANQPPTYRGVNGTSPLPLVQTVFVNTDHDDCVASGVQASDCDTSGEGEWALDSTSSTAMAPDVQYLYYFFPSALGNASGFQAWADYSAGDPSHPTGAPIPMQENASWGECEIYGTTNTTVIPVADGSMVTYTNAFVDADGKGKTQFVSAGDLGGGCTLTGVNGVTNGGVPQVQWPCSSEWVVCVGGTVLYTNGDTTASTEQRANLGGTCTPTTGVNQTNFCDEIAWQYTGGGTSIVRQAPSWQLPLSPVPLAGRCTIDQNDNPITPPGPVCRGVPDVAAMSGDISVLVGGEGFDDVEGGTPQTASGGPTPGSETVDGGTSLSDPLWEGLWADAQSDSRTPTAPSGCAGCPPTWGFAAPALYSIGLNQQEDQCSFYDVQVTQGGTTGPQSAIARDTADPSGWDYVSGFGTPNLTCLENELAATAQQQPVVPEAPVVPLLVVPGFGAALLAGWRRRRRARG